MINKNGVTELMIAASRGDVAAVEALLKAGGDDVDVKNSFGKTALMFAAESGHHDIVLALLRRGADVSARNQIGVTAFQIATSRGHVHICQLLNDAPTLQVSNTSNVKPVSSLDYADSPRENEVEEREMSDDSQAYIKCPQCGLGNWPTDTRCERCGATFSHNETRPKR